MVAWLLVCRGCVASPAEPATDELPVRIENALRDAALGDDLRVRAVDCLGGCDTPRTIALQGDGLASYVFAGLDDDDDIADIVATCRTWLASADGWIEDARPCGRLRHLLRARIPALTRP